ncbi:hypothetical protein DMB45_00220 [Sanguibacteroides justesenii]|uniref:hypothetical protein n=1 Tax=Sanguibacteroides justesenii TaxID=1547597 RepID=UPI000D83DB5E|nr:hypothetical protein [Sanguibacteroides justesenii]PXZ44908.1 hypothetical protein DMB45_00220 [Sanguibacteroides justesenii]
MMVTDITQTQDGDIEFNSGDLIYSESTGQHQRDILLADKGHYKEFPTLGVGTINYLNDTEPENFLRTVRKEYTADGMKVKNIKIINNELTIEAEYESNNS